MRVLGLFRGDFVRFMRTILLAALGAASVLAAPIACADPLTYAGLKTMVANMGYTPKEIGTTDSPKFEATVVTASFNVPVGFEVTKSSRYIWATASLGASKLDGERALLALKRSTDIQPTSFWITSKGILMIGIPIDNREVTPAHLKFVLEKLAGDVTQTTDVWQAAPATPAQ